MEMKDLSMQVKVFVWLIPVPPECPLSHRVNHAGKDGPSFNVCMFIRDICAEVDKIVRLLSKQHILFNNGSL